MKTNFLQTNLIPILLGVLLLASYGHLYFLSYRAEQNTLAFASTSAQTLMLLEQKSLALSDELYASRQDLETIKERLGGFESTVTTLEKLAKTDPELLQKYSKVFFLNEHYSPERLAEIERDYIFNKERPEKINALVLPFLEDMLNEAQDDDIDMLVKSAYRSFEEQSALKSSYTITYGAGTANAFSADQGYSEHQLGTTIDFTTSALGGQLTAGFDKTGAFSWLKGNAHEYGFILSYPQNNGYYIYEPWHWRFVGVDLASSLNRREKNFYDLEQREIDEYLAEMFD